MNAEILGLPIWTDPVIKICFKLFFAFIAFVALNLAIKYMNHTTGLNFREHVHGKLTEDGRSMALYLGLRFVGACLLFGLALL